MVEREVQKEQERGRKNTERWRKGIRSRKNYKKKKGERVV